jgi:hypothetical protein
LLPVILLISILLGLIPLAGIVWIIISGTVTTVDGLFESLILLTIAGVFFLNVFWELRERGFLLFLRKVKAGAKPPSADES